MAPCLWVILLHGSTDKSSGENQEGCSENIVSFCIFPTFLIPCPLIFNLALITQSTPSLLSGSSHMSESLEMTQGVIESIVSKDYHAYLSHFRDYGLLLISYILYRFWFLFWFFFIWEDKHRCSWNCLFHYPSGTLFGWINEFMDHKMQSYWIDGIANWILTFLKRGFFLSLTEEDSATHLFKKLRSIIDFFPIIIKRWSNHHDATFTVKKGRRNWEFLCIEIPRLVPM